MDLICRAYLMRRSQMKLRLGFVTNSSSTNYVLIWKGEPEDIYKLIKEADIRVIPELLEKIEYAIGQRITKEWVFNQPDTRDMAILSLSGWADKPGYVWFESYDNFGEMQPEDIFKIVHLSPNLFYYIEG